MSGVLGRLVLLIALCLLALPARAQPSEPPPAVEQLIRLLSDPAVQSWLETRREAPAPTEAETPVPQARDRLVAVREHLRAVAEALRQLPAASLRASQLITRELREHGLADTLLLVLGFVALGYGSEQAYWRATRRMRAWIGVQRAANVPERLRLIGLRLAFGLSLVGVFGLGSVGAFLLFGWPPLLHQIGVALLGAVVATRLALIVGRVFLVPGGHGLDEPERYRIIPVSTGQARFWQRRLAWFIGFLAGASALLATLSALGFEPLQRAGVAYLLGLGLLAIGLETLWRRPRSVAAGSGRVPAATAVNVVLSACGIVLWLLWVSGLTELFWLGAVALLLPAAIAVTQSAVTHLLRPDEMDAPSRRGVLAVCIERGLRTALIVAAALWLAHVWSIDLLELTSRDTTATRIVRGVLTGVVALLLADLAWQVAKTALDARLAETASPLADGSEEAVRRARLRTLLPILRNILFVVIVVIAGLTALSALGVDIGPLIAGAGVFGVAVGFGAQTLVKDVISGIFYLLDDAFRVGEYIQSGSYKGTVESFSLRSIKLRHHRGPVTTVPFGELGAVQNMSRDWVIDKFQINVGYDTDLEKARKLIKKIGQDLAADPELGPNIIEPMKMQGVEQFGDYGVQIRCKMTTRPGEQFVIRRKAYARIKQAFDENGIKFAFPTVQVAGGAEPAAIAHQGLQLVKAGEAAR